MTTPEQLWSFVGRSDVFAEQQASGQYFPVKTELTTDFLEEHLGGVSSYGTYVIDPATQAVQFIVFDLDTYDNDAISWLVTCLQEFIQSVTAKPDENVYKCLLLENSGGKGYHAWLLLSEAVPATKVRAWVADSFTPLWSQRAGEFPGTPLEVFPKQDTVLEGAYGNLVKLPFGVHAKSGRRSEVVLHTGWADTVDSVQRLDVSLIPDIAIPERAVAQGVSGQTAPFPCISRLIAEGAPQGNRDNAMYHFARYAHSAGLPDDMVVDWCERVNQEFDPPLTDIEVVTKARSACGAKEGKHSCNAEWLKDFCPGGESCHAPWNDERTGKVTDTAVTSYLEMTPEQRREARLRGRV